MISCKSQISSVPEWKIIADYLQMLAFSQVFNSVKDDVIVKALLYIVTGKY